LEVQIASFFSLLSFCFSMILFCHVTSFMSPSALPIFLSSK
jgi:hypothetical protein